MRILHPQYKTNTATTTKTTQNKNNTKQNKNNKKMNHVVALTRKAWRIIKLNYLNNKSFVYPANTADMQPIEWYNRRQYWRGTQILLFFFKLMEFQPVDIGHCCSVFSTVPYATFVLSRVVLFFDFPVFFSMSYLCHVFFVQKEILRTPLAKFVKCEGYL